MTIEASRRALFARYRGGPAQLRPPWSRREDDFIDACTRCAKCVEVCPTGLLTKGHAGYPIADFIRGHCTFCRACADACEAACFVARDAETAPWPLTATISTACIEPKGVSCRMCEDACDVAAILFRPARGGGAVATVSADVCTGCGACVARCPVKAISISTPVPAEAHA